MSEREASLGVAVRQFIRLLGLMREHRRRLALELLLGFFVQGLTILPPYLSKLLIDRVYPTSDVSLMEILVAVILGVILAKALMRSVWGYFQVHVQALLSRDMRLHFFNHLQHLSSRFFDEHRTGEIMSRFNDLDASFNTVGGVLRTLILSTLYLLVIPPLLFLLDWRLALVALAAIPLNILITTASGRVLKAHWRNIAESGAELRAFQTEALSHIRTFKAMALEGFAFQRTAEGAERLVEAQKRTGRLSHLFGLASSVLYGLTTAAYTWWGWHRILAGDLSLGSMVAFTAYVTMLFAPISDLINLFSTIQGTSVNIGRMFEYLDEPPEQDPAVARETLPRLAPRVRGRLRMEEVSFGYGGGKELFSGVDLDIPVGARVAVVGPSGSGKTSLIRLLTRMEDPLEGRIFLDATPVEQIPLTVLRRQVTVLWQEVSILQGTLWDNLTLGLTDPDEARVAEVVALCRLAELVADSPLGYQAPVGEWGASLSAGQRQRLALARALLRDAPVLILDEATSHLDEEMELEILNALFQHLEGRTILYITHRPNAALLADEIYLVDQGEIQRLQPDGKKRPTSAAVG